jgi:hypothetical protein
MAQAQSVLIGDSHIVIKCNPDWDCCQREQAKNKVDGMRKDIAAGTRKTIFSADDMDLNLGPSGLRAISVNWTKARYCDHVRNRYETMKPTEPPEDRRRAQATEARDAGAAPCLVEKIESGETTISQLELDHPLECKLGGNPLAKLVPLDRTINAAFGAIACGRGRQIASAYATKQETASAQEVIDGVKKEKEEKGEPPISGVSLICPPSSPGCPTVESGEAQPNGDVTSGKNYGSGKYQHLPTSTVRRKLVVVSA